MNILNLPTISWAVVSGGGILLSRICAEWQSSRGLLLRDNTRTPQSTHRVATAAFWLAFHHDGKISPGWWEWRGGALPPPFTIVAITYNVAVYAPAERADTLPPFHLYPYVLCARTHQFRPSFSLCCSASQLLVLKKITRPSITYFSSYRT